MDRIAYQKLMPEVDDLNRPFWEGCCQGVLRVQRARGSGGHVFPPSSVDPKTLNDDLEWVDVSGKGVLWSWIVMHQRYFSAFQDELPYVVAFVALDEGPMMMSTLTGPIDSLACGQRLTVEFHSIDAEISIPKFRIAS
ncbi:Zn-ribbon domain-containing OB-fold protein [Tardiphaga sp. 619_E2_N8_5]|uniref:Zn-ribbon domain-containing OB-fold protein n=1 Tax=unclassified Tardiphaga TaxID=2631404 RepID=UPI003F24543A